MTVLIGSWEFEGPFDQISDLNSEPGLCAILHSPGNNEFELVEMEESDSVKQFIEQHNKFHFATQTSAEKFAVAVYYCSDLTASLRQGLIDEVMKEFDSPEESGLERLQAVLQVS